ncbi:MAG: hypothetical protein EP318_06450 [Rhodobacteraceae bacterium]|nr:MAG: hypothetical protein EP318_06450 [Paracoccaceae bacterium]
MRLISTLAALGVLASAVPAMAASVYGCRGLADGGFMASVEGREGVFFRVAPDLMNSHPMTQETVEDLARLSRALAEKGTALIFAPVPTKALALPRFLPPEAADFGFDPSLATTDFLDALARLQAAGVRAVDLRAGMRRAEGPLPYFRTDPRLTAQGARLAAQAIGAVAAQVPGADTLARNRFETRPTGTARVPSHARLVRQRHCEEPLPEAETGTFDTERIYTADGPQGVIALVGSEHSDTPEANFAGFLAEATGIDVIQYSVPGGGAFAAISTYLTSAEFQRARPSMLVWELPLEDAPGLYDDQRMEELIAAARGTCDLALDIRRDAATPQALTVDLSALEPGTAYTLFVDSGGAPARRAEFTYRSTGDRTRSREILRHPAQLPTGRFFLPVTSLWPEGAAEVTVTLDVPMGDEAEVRACLR